MSKIRTLHCRYKSREEQESTIDMLQYIDVFRANFFESAELLGIRAVFNLHQANDPKHKSGIVQTWLIWNCHLVMQSKSQSLSHQISNKSDMKNGFVKERKKITPDITKKLVESIPKRHKGVNSKY